MSTADDFYSIMGVLAREILEFGLMEPNSLVQVRRVSQMNQIGLVIAIISLFLLLLLVSKIII